MDPENSTITGLSEIYILLARDRRLDERAGPILSFPTTILRLHANLGFFKPASKMRAEKYRHQQITYTKNNIGFHKEIRSAM